MKNKREIYKALIAGKSLSLKDSKFYIRVHLNQGGFLMDGFLMNKKGENVEHKFKHPEDWSIDDDHKPEMYESVEAIAKAVKHMQELLK